MKSVRKILAGVLGISFVSTGVAADFDDAMKLLKKSLVHTRGLVPENYFSPARTWKDTDGNEFFAFKKHASGMEVFGEKKLVVIPADQNSWGLRAAQSFSPEDQSFMEGMRRVEFVPNLDQEEAMKIAIQHLRKHDQILHEAVPAHLASSAKLVWYRKYTENYLPVWHLVLPGHHEGFKTTYEFFVDARNGEIVDKIRNLFEADGKGYDLTYSKLYTFPVEKSSDNKFIMKDSGRKLNIYVGSKGKFSADEDAMWDRVGTTRKENQRAEVELLVNFQKTVDYYKNAFGVEWKNGREDVHATAHVKENFNNAYFSQWEGGFFFGDGSGDEAGFDFLTRGLDVVAHEFTHGIESMLAPLTYSGESGALNEHIADFFGIMVDDANFEVGENVMINNKPALRSMSDPARGKANLLKEGMSYDEWVQMHKDNGLKVRVYPDRTKLKVICDGWSEDNGGVHLNNNIFNKFSYLMITGNEINSPGLGRELSAAIYMRMMKDGHYSSNASFKDFRDALLTASALHLKTHPKKDVYMQTIKKAFARIDL